MFVSSSPMARLPLIGILFVSLLSPALAEDPAYRWIDEPGKYTDLYLGDRPLARYVYEALDDSSKERREATYKPFHHIYLPDGSGFLTKGPGGKFTHHRGIYFGFSHCTFTNAEGEEEVVETWHSRRAHSMGTKSLESRTSASSGGHKVEIEWRSDASGTFLTEHRDLTFQLIDERVLQVDFVSTLITSLPGGVHLDGDPQHAGFQFRASNEVFESTKNRTYYTRPTSGKDEPGKTINAP
ncbi:MAG: DUF6807 family protein, partial [Verrucomicrobiota bacterium]